MPGARLSVVERAKIETLFGQGLTYPEIAERIGRSRTTVWREVERNNSRRGARCAKGQGARHPHRKRGHTPGLSGSYRWLYSCEQAQRKADERARRKRAGKLRPGHGRAYPPLWSTVKAKLELRWSPMQISRWLTLTYPDQPEMHVSHETIYQAIYFQARGGFRMEIGRQVALRSGRRQRKPQSRKASADRTGKAWVKGFNVSTRPAEAEDRAVPGHWEGDLVLGARSASAIVTLVERHSRYVMLGSLPRSRVSEEVIGVLIERMGQLPDHLLRSLTWDQGSEMAKTTKFTLATNCQVYFCDPHSPWQRGSNENTNGLLRQYFPRSSTDFRTYTQADLDAVAAELNGRPRQTLDWRTPAQTLNDFLVATTT